MFNCKTDVEPIDFIITWVDGSDPEWIAHKSSVVSSSNSDDRNIRYRDWDTLPYLFRGIESFTPWVNRIHFITWGHLPSWLNVNNPKLNIVNHKDYIPEEYLPTFSSHTIELNMHRITGLAQKFVYFNDDMFLLRPLKPQHFFLHDLPRDYALMNPAYTMDLADESGDNRIFYIPYNNVNYLNKRYTMRNCVNMYPLKWYNVKYGCNLFRNILLYPWPRFVGFIDNHLPQSYLKISFSEAWADEFSKLNETCLRPIRTDHDVNHWYIRYRQLAEGKFIPKPPLRNAVYSMKKTNNNVFMAISNPRTSMVCINDSPKVADAFIGEKEKLKHAFEKILPQKSSFEV